jgi:hypothetical protein
MEKLYTENALIRYIYNECDFFERFEVEDAIEHDDYTHNMYLELCEIFYELPQIRFVPSQKTIRNILAAASKAID